jgi:hypothetical protein
MLLATDAWMSGGLTFTLNPAAEPNEPRLIRLPKSWLPTIREYVAAKLAKQQADKASRNAETTMK